jgi:hypothetical protein
LLIQQGGLKPGSDRRPDRRGFGGALIFLRRRLNTIDEGRLRCRNRHRWGGALHFQEALLRNSLPYTLHYRSLAVGSTRRR